MKAVITVAGKDMVGIIHKVSGKLYQHGINILDITQSIIGDNFFTMIMLVDISNLNMEFNDLCIEFDELSKELKLSITVQHEDIFNAMHNI